MKLSIVIPALNEAGNIQDTLNPLQYLRKSGHEIILVDGGSTDATCFLAGPLVDQLLVTEPGRARQMNRGVEMATGNVLVFLHADSKLPENIDNIINRISRASFWGRFDIRLSGYRLIFRIIEKLINLRSRITGIATGDQGIFMTRGLYKSVGGFPDIPLMEDIAISKKLKRHSLPVVVAEPVVTSSRRWEQKGIMKTVLLMWLLRLQFSLGADPRSLVKKYE